MQTANWQALAALISTSTERDYSPITESKACGGGCIHYAEIVQLADGRRYFAKSNQGVGDMFAQEAYGLAALKQVAAIRIPKVIAVGMLDDCKSALVLEAIDAGSIATDFWEDFGSRFARLHQNSISSQAGWSSDNYIGSNRQPNTSHPTWTEFFAQCRLEFQLRLARNNSRGSPEMFRLARRLIDRLDDFLAHAAEPMVLLHGDLWSGNYLIDEVGGPVLIDPACYYGHREADLAMPLLFGGFPDKFFASYQATWPLRDDWRERVEIYKLYHLLNHLNLFGSGYLDGCLEILRRFA